MVNSAKQTTNKAMKTIKGTLTGQDRLSEFWGNLQIPVIACDCLRPVFYESGYASGHANEKIEVAGLFDWLKSNQQPEAENHRHFAEYPPCEHHNYTLLSGWAWTWIEFKDKRSLVFLSSHGNGKGDLFHMSN